MRLDRPTHILKSNRASMWMSEFTEEIPSQIAAGINRLGDGEYTFYSIYPLPADAAYDETVYPDEWIQTTGTATDRLTVEIRRLDPDGCYRVYTVGHPEAAEEPAETEPIHNGDNTYQVRPAEVLTAAEASISFSTTTTNTRSRPATTSVNKLNSPHPPTIMLCPTNRPQEPRAPRQLPPSPPRAMTRPNRTHRLANRRAGSSAVPIDPASRGLMSYDILAFDPGAAPGDDDLLAWYHKQAEWSEPHSYDDPAVTTPELRAFYRDLIKVFPPLNGPGRTRSRRWQRRHRLCHRPQHRLRRVPVVQRRACPRSVSSAGPSAWRRGMRDQ